MKIPLSKHTNRSSTDEPPNGTFISSRCIISCGAFNKPCGTPCGKLIGPANAANGPNEPNAGTDCGGIAPGICCA